MTVTRRTSSQTRAAVRPRLGMAPTAGASSAPGRERRSRRTFLAGVSAIALTMACSGAEAGGLRDRGAAGSSATAAAAAASQAGAQAAAVAAAQAMSRVNGSLQAMRNQQAAARAAAQAAASTVPNGLAPGGLVVAPGAVPSATNFGSGLWQGAHLPAQRTLANGRTQVEVKQNEQKAILTWQSFNVGRETDLYFNQTAGGADVSNWIALNRVLDPSASPSRILGTIKAEGQVYIINKNGIIFGGSSQVNTHTLIASSLRLTNEQFMVGINKPRTDVGYGGNSVAFPQFGEYATGMSGQGPAFNPEVPGDVVVQAGAQLQAGSGGKLMLFGPKVRNAGQLSASDGQIILAAGEQVYLNSDLNGVRGLDVAVSAPMPWAVTYDEVAGVLGVGFIFSSFQYTLRDVILPEMDARAAAVGYNVTNDGSIVSDRGNITLHSREVNQNGALIATSALNNREGSIRLRAWGQGMLAVSSSLGSTQVAHWAAGTLTLSPGSVTTVMPDGTDTSEIEQTALATRYRTGRIDLRGGLIDIQSLASVVAPSGTISAIAGSPVRGGENPSLGPVETPTDNDMSERDGSRIYIDSDAFLSVAGLQDVLVPMTRNFVEAELRINELRDSPLYRDSWLRGKKVIVDRRAQGTFDDGPMAGVRWVMDEDGNYVPGAWQGTPLADVTGWVGVGRTDLQELSTKAGSIILKSGGSVITRKGSLLDVSGGSVRYTDGWNNTTKLLGADGRIYDVRDATPDRIYVGFAADGFRRNHARWGVTETWGNSLRRGQRFEPGYVEGRDAGSIAIYGGEALILEGGYWGGTTVSERQKDQGNLPEAGKLLVGGATDPYRYWSFSDLVISHSPQVLAAEFTATTEVDSVFYRPGQWPASEKTSWLSAAALNSSGLAKIDLYVTNDFTLEAGTTLELRPGAELAVTSNASTNSNATFTVAGKIRIAGGKVTLGTAGSGLQNLHLGATGIIDVSGELGNDATNGAVAYTPMIDGGEIFLSSVATTVASGAILDVSGGGWVKNRNNVAEISVGDAGTITLPMIDGDQIAALDLRAFAAGSGGSLVLETASSVQLGGAAPADPSLLHVPATLYAERGFRSVSITSNGHIVVPDGAVISQRPVNVDLSGSNYAAFASGAKITDVGKIGLLRLEERAAREPASLTLATRGGDVVVGAGALLQTDLGGKISIAPRGNATIRGTVEAPAGVIDIKADGSTLLAGGASLIARGAPVIWPDSRGWRGGFVRSGGTVSVSAVDLLTLESGSLIDVSGASGVIDVVDPAGGSRRGTQQTEVVHLVSDGGSITLKGNGTIAGRLVGRPGGPGANGGRLTIDHLGSPDAGGPSPAEAILSALAMWDPTCWYGPACESNPLNAIGFDVGRIYEEVFGYGAGAFPDMIITQALIDRLSAGRSELILSETAQGSSAVSTPLNLAQYGLTPEALDAFRDFFFFDDRLRQALQSPPGSAILAVRPSAINAGGFADLRLNATTAPILLDGVNLAATRSIVLGGAVANAAGGNSTIAAPYVALMATGTAGATGGRAGRLEIAGSLVEIIQAGTIRGFAVTEITATDLRLTTPLGEETGPALLDVEGELTLRAGQVYPATGVQAIIKATDRIVVERNGAVAPPMSAGGQLTLEAPVIEQNGVLRAPFGQIVLKAGDRLTLGAGSITSVSGAGLVVPYGSLSNGEHWVDPTEPTDFSDPSANYMAQLPEKRITLEAPVVVSGAGSLIDIQGGGDLYAREFVPGPGGSHDILAMPGAYAILPGYTGSTPPAGGGVGDRIWLAGGNGLAAGWHTLLPASYAALPGAYLVSSSGGPSTLSAFGTARLVDGSVMMSGRRGNALTGNQDQLLSPWRVMSGTQLRQYSEYNEAFANSYFASETFKLARYRLTGQNVVTPRLAMDGGSLLFKAAQELILAGQVQSQAAEGGRGGLVDIAGEKIAIVGAGQDGAGLRAAGYLVVDSGSLSGFGAASLLIGGIRTGDALGLRIEVTASDIVVRNGDDTALTGPEVILAASDRVVVEAGSVVAAKGKLTGGSVDLVMTEVVKAVYTDPDGSLDDNWDGVVNAADAADDVLTSPPRDYGALIRIANGDAVKVIRQNVDTTVGGLVSVGAGARLEGGQSLLIDATQNTVLAGAAQISGVDLSVASGKIGFGGGSNGLVLDSAALSQLSGTKHLTLRSYSTIDFYTAVDLGGAGLAAVTFDAAGLVGAGTGNITVSGNQIVLANSGASLSTTTPTGLHGLALVADELVLGQGDKAILGFSDVTLTGRQRILAEGSGRLDAGAAALRLETPILTGHGGASQSIVTAGVLTVGGAASAPTGELTDSLGTRLSLTGASIVMGSRIVALGGAVALTASTGDLVLTDGAVIDVGGFAKPFFDVIQYGDAGRIDLNAAGDVRLQAGSALNLAANPGGGNAGVLAITSDGGAVSLGGRIGAQAAAGGKAGSFTLDIGALPDFAGLSQRLNDAGFFAARQFRIRTGNVTIDGTTQVAEFELAADQGVVTIDGAIDARSQYGGRIAISGGHGLTMTANARIQAGATDAELGSGRVTLDAGSGTLDIVGGSIDVGGGEGGKVRFRALQNASHTAVTVNRLNATITGARSKVLEGVVRYHVADGGTVDSVMAAAVADANSFANQAPAQVNGVTLASGIEIVGDGDLTLNSDWNLAGLVSREGALTLRAKGNLSIQGNISDGFSAADRSGELLDAASWDLRLVAGADLTSANALAVTPLTSLPGGSGSLIVGDAATDTGKLIRTGTGDIDVRAGRDIDLASNKSVIYTAGRKDVIGVPGFDATPGVAYGIGGGHLDIAAQGSISSALPTDKHDYQLFTEWLRRRGATDPVNMTSFEAGQQSTWWVNYGTFQQGVGALGGGNVAVSAGGDLTNLLVALPTIGRVSGGRTMSEAKSLDVRNGGAMTVDAAGAINGGQYYIGRGTGSIVANELAIGRTIQIARTGGTVTSHTVAPVLALGDATLDVTTKGDLRMQTVVDPLFVGQSRPNDAGRPAALMSGYTARTALELVSTGGDITLVNDPQSLFGNLDLNFNNGFPVDLQLSDYAGLGGNRYPAITHVTAFNGGLTIGGLLATMPAKNAELRILVENDIRLTNQIGLAAAYYPIGHISMSRAVPETVPSPYLPSTAGSLLPPLDVTNPTRLPMADDHEPSRIYSRSGSIIGERGGNFVSITSNEQTWIRSGQAIRDLPFTLRNLHRTDVTVLESGNDILNSTITIEGPGALLLTAGRDVYNTNAVSIGNRQWDSNNRPIFNSDILGLPQESASITVMAGLQGKRPSYETFMTAYLDPANVAAMPDYLKTTMTDGSVVPIYLTDRTETRKNGQEKTVRRGLVSFIQEMTGEALSPMDAWARFQTLPALTREAFLRRVYMQELRDAGRDQNEPGENGLPRNGGYNRGYLALETLFPGKSWNGDVVAQSMRLRTMAGGDIEVLAPGGGLEVAALGADVPVSHGLVTLGSGHINIFTRDSVVVNRSRILTFVPEATQQGSDMIIWSTLGDIDAGRGSKTLRVPSAPDVRTDADGNTVILEGTDMSGSGIGTIGDGDVDLVAPEGTVNAGDAGVRVAGNFSVAARFVLNVDNIDVGGEVKGLPKPQATVAPLSVETKDKAAADAVRDATMQATPSERPSVIIVEILGYGGGDGTERPQDGQRKKEEQSSLRRPDYNPGSKFQVIGNGELTEEQKSRLTEAERGRL